MKTKLLIATILSTVILTPSIARAEWIHVASTQAGEVFIEDASIKSQGDAVKVWRQDFFYRPVKGKARSIVGQYSVSCSNSTTTTISSTPYTSNGKMINDSSYSYTAGKVSNNIPGTAGYAVQEMVCN